MQATNGKLETSVNFKFDHVREISIAVTEEMVEHCTEGALSIEVYGHRSATGIHFSGVDTKDLITEDLNDIRPNHT